MAFEALERGLLQAGQMSDDVSVVLEVEFEAKVDVEKEIVTRDFRLRGCGAEGEEAGQMGESFRGVEEVLLALVDGVREGIQKAWRVGLADYLRAVSN